MAAIRRADTDNREKLRQMFPEVFAEFWVRYHAPGGFLNREEMANILGGPTHG
jgi:hypothetical protein